MARTVRRPNRLRGTIQVPGDKSISHRAAMLGALATGRTMVRRFLAAEDTRSTLRCLSALGIEWRLDEQSPGVAELEVIGAGLGGLREPDQVMDAGNSGTTLRLLSGILAAQPFLSILTGDDSLRARPVDRVVEPLRQMGAHLSARDGDRLPPLVIRGGQLQAIHYKLPVASAQVKTAVLLGGLYAKGQTVLEEPLPTRDHTERMLRAMDVDVRREGPGLSLEPPDSLSPLDFDVPGDISTAAFWLVAGTVHPKAEITLPKVSVNPSRAGILDALTLMGAKIDIGEQRMVGEEPVADITVRSSQLTGIEVAGELVPRLIDELPALAVAAAFAQGRTVVRDAPELRVKETDRIAAIARGLGALGATIEERPDGFAVDGGSGLRGAQVSGGGDHRLTMALAMAGLLAEGETGVADEGSVAVSNPNFWQDLDRIGGS